MSTDSTLRLGANAERFLATFADADDSTEKFCQNMLLVCVERATFCHKCGLDYNESVDIFEKTLDAQRCKPEQKMVMMAMFPMVFGYFGNRQSKEQS
jgi:hypothetical protein